MNSFIFGLKEKGVFIHMKSIYGKLNIRCANAIKLVRGLMKLMIRQAACLACMAVAVLSIVNVSYAQQAESNLYKTPEERDSEFDNASDGFVKSWRNAEADYEDTVFGELIYNEPSTPTKLEMLRLLSKDTPSTLIFMHAISMGLGIEEILQASVRFSPEKARDLAGSAVSLLPLLNRSEIYHYSSYDLDSLQKYVRELSDEKRKDYKIQDGQAYSVHAVIDRFFDGRLTLSPHPDWYDGQVHFMATARELSSLHFQTINNGDRWYRSKSSKSVEQRPIFISLYEYDKSVIIDGEERIRKALAHNPDTELPVVFIYNRLNERPIDKIDYPETLHGLRDAYIKENLMVTPPPEWQIGEYHIFVEISEFYQLFEIPSEDDYEPEVWEKLLVEAENYDVNETAFIAVILGGVGLNKEDAKEKLSGHALGQQNPILMAAWDDPRSESQFKYTSPSKGIDLSLNGILGKGIVFNRPDLVAALNALGATSIPVTVYYLDGARVKPFTKGPRSLIQAAIGIEPPVTVPPTGGGIPLPPASPPGL